MVRDSALSIAFFGSSLVSAYWNGAATYYRGMVRALAGRGHRTTFYEPDAYDRQRHRDIPDPDWARVVVYPADGLDGVRSALKDARSADVLIKASGVGVFDEYLDEQILEQRPGSSLAVFWDVDAPATLERLQNDPLDPFLGLIPRYDLILTYGGGGPVVQAYHQFGARQCVPVYNGVDPSTHHPVAPDPRFACDLAFLGNRLPDRESRVDRFFLDAARLWPEGRFLLGGSGWDDKRLPSNASYIGHVYTSDHNAFNVSPRAVLNISRESMARNGYSPATRVFEAASAGACLITDEWEGISLFFEPGREILVASDGPQVADLARNLSETDAKTIGRCARERALAEHSYARRAETVEQLLQATFDGTPEVSLS